MLDDLSKGVQEKILLMMLSSIYQLEDFLQEEIRVPNRYVSKANRCGCSDLLILDLELVLNSIHYVGNRGKILEFPELAEAQAALNLVARSDDLIFHVINDVPFLALVLIVQDCPCEAHGGSLALYRHAIVELTKSFILNGSILCGGLEEPKELIDEHCLALNQV